jgi:hypothetical protein
MILKILILKTMKRNIVVIGIVFGIIGWSCQKVETPPQGLKLSIEKASSDINTAISKISATKGYQLLTSGSNFTSKSEVEFKDSITLGLVAGIYDYQPDSVKHYHSPLYPYRLFKKTGESNDMIVNLPEKLIFHCNYLHNYNPADSVLKNNFTITASDYHLYYNWWNNLDYKLAAGLTLDNEDLGSMDISAVSNTYKDQTYSSAYTFPGGYNISATWQTGDTAVSTFALLQNSDVLLKETTAFMGTGFHRRERLYTLTIGNIDIKRGYGLDSIQVYQNGVLQSTAGAKITDSADTTGTICSKRDILLTFDDGTTAKLSDLIGPALTELRTLWPSLHDMYFAENVVDYIAINIYYNSR